MLEQKQQQKESTGTTEVTENKKNYEELSKTDKRVAKLCR